MTCETSRITLLSLILLFTIEVRQTMSAKMPLCNVKEIKVTNICNSMAGEIGMNIKITNVVAQLLQKLVFKLKLCPTLIGGGPYKEETQVFSLYNPVRVALANNHSLSYNNSRLYKAKKGYSV